MPPSSSSPEAGHMLPYEHPDAVVTAVNRFLA